jgi:hypothetical protein
MQKIIQRLLILLSIILLNTSIAYSIIAPIRFTANHNVLLVSCDEINLKFERIELYHHPIGIWLVNYEAILKNDRSLPIKQMVGFPSGFEMREIDNDLYCDQFDNFQVLENNTKIQSIKYFVRCMNYVETTGSKWELDDGSGVGFLNTWELDFEPEESKTIKITFCINVNKPPMNFDTNNGESWYTDAMEWIKSEYESREQNHFQLPLNLGSFWRFYPDSINIRTYLADDWLSVIDLSKREYKKEHITHYEFSEPFGFYSPPQVYSKTLSSEELQKMTRAELKILKNSFPAKYGRTFNNKMLNSFFIDQPWYFENPDFHPWLLTDWDIENIKVIHEFEKNLP